MYFICTRIREMKAGVDLAYILISQLEPSLDFEIWEDYIVDFYVGLSENSKSQRGEVGKAPSAPSPTLTTPLPILQLDQASSSPSQLIFGGTQRLYFALLLMFDSGFKSSIAFKGHFATCSKGPSIHSLSSFTHYNRKSFLPLIQSQILCLASL